MWEITLSRLYDQLSDASVNLLRLIKEVKKSYSVAVAILGYRQIKDFQLRTRQPITLKYRHRSLFYPHCYSLKESAERGILATQNPTLGELTNV